MEVFAALGFHESGKPIHRPLTQPSHDPEAGSTLDEQQTPDRRRGRRRALDIAAVLAVLGIGWWASTALGEDQTDVERAQEVFASAVMSEFPNATIKRDTMVCRRADTPNPVEDEDFFCDATIKRSGKAVKVSGRLPANLTSAQVSLADAEAPKR